MEGVMWRACVATLVAVIVASGANYSRAEAQILLSAAQDTPAVESQPTEPAATEENQKQGEAAESASGAAEGAATTARPPTAAADETDILPGAPPLPKRLRLAGPRFGVTYLSDGVIRKLRKRYGSEFDERPWPSPPA
jgi:hypothetical protein